MKNQPHCLTTFVLGLAYALEHIKDLVPGSPRNLRAYLFSFKRKLAHHYFDNLMAFVQQMETQDFWITSCAKRYAKEPLNERGDCFDELKEFLGVERKILEDDSFDFSFLQPFVQDFAKEVFQRHHTSYRQIVTFLYGAKPSLGAEYDFGILFVQEED